mmetsp:Transcript_33809/g.111829  ORF Transcript_33809/g.111829 Transcript_33809/m.111829 type:complete len:251 (+) Transcript_33809:406-1158(+)
MPRLATSGRRPSAPSLPDVQPVRASVRPPLRRLRALHRRREELGQQACLCVHHLDGVRRSAHNPRVGPRRPHHGLLARDRRRRGRRRHRRRVARLVRRGRGGQGLEARRRPRCVAPPATAAPQARAAGAGHRRRARDGLDGARCQRTARAAQPRGRGTRGGVALSAPPIAWARLWGAERAGRARRVRDEVAFASQAGGGEGRLLLPRSIRERARAGARRPPRRPRPRPEQLRRAQRRRGGGVRRLRARPR